MTNNESLMNQVSQLQTHKRYKYFIIYYDFCFL